MNQLLRSWILYPVGTDWNDAAKALNDLGSPDLVESLFGAERSAAS